MSPGVGADLDCAYCNRSYRHDGQVMAICYRCRVERAWEEFEKWRTWARNALWVGVALGAVLGALLVVVLADLGVVA